MRQPHPYTMVKMPVPTRARTKWPSRLRFVYAASVRIGGALMVISAQWTLSPPPVEPGARHWVKPQGVVQDVVG
jgi:hypothetical protein